jgi:N utilization substance protein B
VTADRSSPKVGNRRRARECAMQALYQLELSDKAAHLDDVLHLFWAHLEPEDGAVGEIRSYAQALVAGVARHLPQLDAVLQQASQHWRLERMSRVDRNILRLAAYELLHEADVPARVALNEAIEVAKKFGTEESGAFVNGILDRIAQDARR